MTGKLLAWTEQSEKDTVLAAFIGEGALPHHGREGRAPAIRQTSSFEEARQWVEAQAKLLGLPVQWLENKPV